MCEMAKCAGQPGCTNEPNLYQQLANIRFPDYNQRDPVYTAAENNNYNKIQAERDAFVDQLQKNGQTDTLNAYHSMSSKQVADYGWVRDSSTLPNYMGFSYNTLFTTVYKTEYNKDPPTGDVAKLADYELAMQNAATLARCGGSAC